MNHFLRGKKDPTFLDMEEEDLQQPSNPYTYSTEDDLDFEYPDASMTASAEQSQNLVVAETGFSKKTFIYLVTKQPQE